jgi:hypothetical protein
MASCWSCSYSSKEHFEVCPNCGVEICKEPLPEQSAEMIAMRKRLTITICCLVILSTAAMNFLNPISRSYGFHFDVLYMNFIVPTFPFICLALICVLAPRVSSHSIIGSLIPAIIVMFCLYFGILNSRFSSGDTMKLWITVGISPVYLSILMVIGGLIGSASEPRNDQKRT